MDVTQLILSDHAEFRRLFAIIDDIDAGDRDKLAAVWDRLATFLEVHAETEERIFYPQLLRVDGGQKKRIDAEVKDAIKDHNEIRDAVAAVRGHEPGSDDWFAAVAKARKANSDHMAEEEREDLADFRRDAPLQVRHDLGVAFAAFEAGHRSGVKPVDKNPKQYVESHA